MARETRRLQRQYSALSDLTAQVDVHTGVLGAILVGSMVDGGTDALSDVDCIIVTDNDAFRAVWADRCALHGGTVTVCWDYSDPLGPPDSGAHKWLDHNLVLVDCLITAAASGVRLAPPYRVVAGPPDVPSHLESRPPIERAEMRGVDVDLIPDLQVEIAYDILKAVVRREREAR